MPDGAELAVRMSPRPHWPTGVSQTQSWPPRLLISPFANQVSEMSTGGHPEYEKATYAADLEGKAVVVDPQFVRHELLTVAVVAGDDARHHSGVGETVADPNGHVVADA